MLEECGGFDKDVNTTTWKINETETIKNDRRIVKRNHELRLQHSITSQYCSAVSQDQVLRLFLGS